MRPPDVSRVEFERLISLSVWRRWASTFWSRLPDIDQVTDWHDLALVASDLLHMTVLTLGT